MQMRFLALPVLLAGVSGLQIAGPVPQSSYHGPSAAQIRLARTNTPCMDASLVVTDGTDSFYGSRSFFQVAHDHGSFSKVTAYCSSTVNAKKMLLSRQARYSGLVDVLNFAEGDAGACFEGCTTWVALNADEVKTKGWIDSAVAAGVERIILHFAEEGPSSELAQKLEGTNVKYTVLKTGKLMDGMSGNPMKVGELADDCEELSKEDVYRFITEALTIDSANNRLLSVTQNADDTQFREMRRAGCDRRDEVEALLVGKIVEKLPQKEDDAPIDPKQAEEDARSQAEKAAEREQELKALLEKARKTGIENQKKMKEEEEEKRKRRLERAELYRTPDEPTSDDDDSPKEEDAPPPPPPKDDYKDDDKKKDDDDEDDGLALA